MRRAVMILAIAGLSGGLASGQAVAQQASSQSTPATEAPRFPAGVDLVTVDVVVVDQKGKAVSGLLASDFRIADEGAPQTISRFEAVQLPTEPPPPMPVRRVAYSSNVSPAARQGRTFLIVYDDIHLSVVQAVRAKAAIAEFLRTGVREGDRVTLIATGGGAWWNTLMPEGRDELNAILKRLDARFVPDNSPDRITDYEAMRIEVYEDPEVAYQVGRRFDAYGAVGRERSGDRTYQDSRGRRSDVGIIDPYIRNRASEVYMQSLSRRKISMGVMRRALTALGEIRGRKAMILVSQGFIFETDFKSTRDLVDASLRANVPIYFIDTRGLTALPDLFTAAFKGAQWDVQDQSAVLADLTRDAEGAESLALDTGGFAVRNTNDLQSGILRVSNESQSFYLIGYHPSNLVRNGKFRKIEVRLAPGKPKGLSVRARRGYFAPKDEPPTPPEGKAGDDPVIVRALDSPFERNEVPLRVTDFAFDETSAGRVNMMLAAEIDVRELAFQEQEGRSQDIIDFYIEAQHRETGEFFRQTDKIELSLLPETRARLDVTGYLLTRDFSLPPGGYQAKFVVRDTRAQRLGSVIHDFTVPEPTQLRITTPILSDTMEERPATAATPPRLVLQVRREFAPGSVLYVQYSVLGAAKGPATQLPRVSAGYEIRRADGSTFKSAPLSRINPTSLGALQRFHGINLGGASTGEYDLILNVRDEIAEQDLQVRQPFVLR
jgi:VWFA-related protein